MIDGRLEKESEYLNGESVWGDDLSEEEIAIWYKDEEKGYYIMSRFIGTLYSWDYHKSKLKGFEPILLE